MLQGVAETILYGSVLYRDPAYRGAYNRDGLAHALSPDLPDPETGRSYAVFGFPVQVAIPHQWSPYRIDDVLPVPAGRTFSRGHMFQEQKPATRPEYPPYLSQAGFKIRHGTADQCGHDTIKRFVIRPDAFSGIVGNMYIIQA